MQSGQHQLGERMIKHADAVSLTAWHLQAPDLYQYSACCLPCSLSQVAPLPGLLQAGQSNATRLPPPSTPAASAAAPLPAHMRCVGLSTHELHPAVFMGVAAGAAGVASASALQLWCLVRKAALMCPV